MTLSRFMTTGEVAELLSMSRPTVNRLIREGKLSAIRIGRDYRVERDSVDSLIGKSRVTA